MEHELAAALEPIMSDLEGPGGVQPDLRDEPWRDDSGTASAFLYAPDGSGQGISIELGQPTVTQVVALADQVQEWAVESLWSMGRATNWPPCPHHPSSHPLAAVARAGRAVWTCPTLSTEISEIGTLAV
ncbi:hypothetical protein LADH09A_001565 [Micromonospora sp. LAH09]|uniref:hypothetical protein n=1 Tax=Micromonospora cabrerizensis TaxID=2911213 RepID=UPI001EE8E48D|nr:hypothetical protein [Micromonospora cabrerizensis]MCG5467754.1 hypothetical protein [Micromonospora cabrerizensis]